MAEFDLIDRIRARVATRDDVVLGIGDDAAVLHVSPGLQLVVAMDTLNAGVHFPEDTAPADIGWKALAVNLSDLAAMGATPTWCTLSLSLPQADEGWIDAFLDGFLALADAHRVALVGGDTTRGPLSVCVTVHGVAAPGRTLRRDAACIGDDVWVSGTLGDAAGALWQWRHEAQIMRDSDGPQLGEAVREEATGTDAGEAARGGCHARESRASQAAFDAHGVQHTPRLHSARSTPERRGAQDTQSTQSAAAAHMLGLDAHAHAHAPQRSSDEALRARLDRPTPRVALGRALAGLAHACIDISDGLLADVAHVARASGVAIEVDVDALPVSHALQALFAGEQRRVLQATGGDDYELFFTAAPADAANIERAAAECLTQVTCIGRVVDGEGVHAFDAGRKAWQPSRTGWVHFA
jgi:thiamine-monophosphate kinase